MGKYSGFDRSVLVNQHVQPLDGGGHPREKDERGRKPHGHVPRITSPDGTPWLPIHK